MHHEESYNTITACVSDSDFKEHFFKTIKALQCNIGAQRYFQTNGKCGRKVTNKYLKVPVEENAYV